MDQQTTVLIVDDEPLNIQIIKILLKNQPVNILTAADGAEAVEATHLHSPDLILMDIRMPKMSGLEATKILRKVYPDLMIVAVTSEPRADYVDSSGDCAPFDRFIQKPIRSKEIKDVVELVQGKLTVT